MKPALNQVHLWLASLEQPQPEIERLRALLDPDEVRRAEQFAFPHLRERFIVGRGVLRSLLGSALDADPAQLRFSYGAQGKPALAGAPGATPLRFNVSHSHNLALYALGWGRELGVDLERERPVDSLGIAGRFFSAREHALLAALVPEAQSEGFFNCWTRKEAYIKACGVGLSELLDKFSVSLAPGQPATLLDVAWDQAEVTRWSLHGWKPVPGYTAALCVEGSNWELIEHQWR